MAAEQKKRYRKRLYPRSYWRRVWRIVLGILAAIAVPAFTRYMKTTKVFESKIMVQKIDNSVKRFYMEQCKFPQDATSSDLPTDGNKVIPNFSKGGFQQIGMPTSDSSYFRYRLVNEKKMLKIIADADFSLSNPGAHTYTMILTAGAKCTIRSWALTTNVSAA